MNKSRSRLTFFLHWIFSFAQIPEVSGLRASPRVDMQEPTGVFCSLTYSWSAVCDVAAYLYTYARAPANEPVWDPSNHCWSALRPHVWCIRKHARTHLHTHIRTHTHTQTPRSCQVQQCGRFFPPPHCGCCHGNKLRFSGIEKLNLTGNVCVSGGGGGDNEGGVDQSRCGRSSRVCRGPPQGADCYINTTPYVNISWPPGSTQVKGSQTLAPVDSSLHLFNCHRDGCTREMLDLIAL